VATASARDQVVAKIEFQPEGRFIVALDQIDSDWFAHWAPS
jgi:hypothetical protein